MTTSDTETELERILQAQAAACLPRKTDADLAHEYAQMMEDILLEVDELESDPGVLHSGPSRRFFKGDKEAWVYDHGKIAELVFVKRD